MHLLIIEDDLELGAELQRALSGLALSSVWLRNARSAMGLDLDRNEANFACVLLDLGLPDGEGLSLLRGWRAAGYKLPVIVLSARDALASRVAALDAGADDYLIKPVAALELASRVRAVTRRCAGQAAARWQIGELLIDTARHLVWLDGQRVELSPTEFLVLAELARHAGAIVPKHRLGRAASSAGELMEFSALEWHIHNLRRKLGETRIRTVRGVGYGLEDAE